MDKTFKKRPLSWSQISSFKYDPRQWYENYILGNHSSSPEMEFGSFIDKKIQNETDFLPDLPRYPLMQHKMKVVFNGIHLVGLPDGLDLEKFLLADYKTGKKKWDKKRADETGQLTMYLLLIFITKKISPEKFRCFIHWLPTQDNGNFEISFSDNFKIQTFETKRTMKDLLMFGKYISETIEDMNQYTLSHPLTT